MPHALAKQPPARPASPGARASQPSRRLTWNARQGRLFGGQRLQFPVSTKAATVSSSARKGRGVAGPVGIPAAIAEQVLAALSALLVYAFMLGWSRHHPCFVGFDVADLSST